MEGSSPDIVSKYCKPKYQEMSIFAFLFSIFLYVSIFYVFDLSPSKLLYNSTFWFFISNTLIVIIAMDFGLFSASSSAIYKHTTLYDDEYVTTMRRQDKSSAPSVVCCAPYPNVVETFIRKEEVNKELQQKQKATHRRKLSAVVENEPGVSFSETKPKKAVALKETEAQYYRKENVPPTPPRVRSGTAKKVVFDESKTIVRRIETEKHEEASHLVDYQQEKNEYAHMSVEELNRRVEEFIQRFNMQIRLQAQA